MTLQKPTYVQGVNYDAHDDRQLVATFATPGVATATALAVAARAAGANMSVDIAAGRAVVSRANPGALGAWAVYNDAVVNLSIDAASGVGARIDLVVVEIQDADASVGTTPSANNAIFRIVKGTVGGGAPTMASTWDGLILAQVAVPQSATSIASGQISTRRALMDYPSVPGRYMQGSAGTVSSPDVVGGVKRFSNGLQIGSGRVIGTQYSEVSLSAAETIPTSSDLSTWTNLNFDTLVDHSDDVDGPLYDIFLKHLNLNGAGLYVITVAVAWVRSPAGATQYRGVRLRTGNGYVIGEDVRQIIPFQAVTRQTLTVAHHLPVGQVYAEVTHNDSGTVQVATNAPATPAYLTCVRVA